MVFPWIQFLKRFGGLIVELSDTIIMSKKEFEGKTVSAQGGTSTVSSTICSYTPASGKTFYLHKAAVNTDNSASSGALSYRVQIRNDGTTIDILEGGLNAGGAVGRRTDTVMEGDSLDGDGVKIFDIYLNSSQGSPTIEATLAGFIEDDADDPLADFL